MIIFEVIGKNGAVYEIEGAQSVRTWEASEGVLVVTFYDGLQDGTPIDPDDVEENEKLGNVVAEFRLSKIVGWRSRTELANPEK